MLIQRRRHRVAGAVERLRQHVPGRRRTESRADDPQPADGDRRDRRVVREQPTTTASANTTNTHADAPRNSDVVQARAPHRRFGALGLARAEILSDERRRRVRQPPRRQQRRR